MAEVTEGHQEGAGRVIYISENEDLARVVEKAPSNTIIVLSPGRYRVTRSVDLSRKRGVRIVGVDANAEALGVRIGW